MDHPLRCKCGTLQGTVTHTESVNHGVCYCHDCQAYAHALGNPEAILDGLDGSDLVATLQKHVIFTQGTEALACLSLSERGLLRWYASCCNTPIGNTPRDPKTPFVGLPHNGLEHSPRSIDEAFGPVRARFNGSYRQTPFFVAGGARPVVVPRVLGAGERARAMNAAGCDR